MKKNIITVAAITLSLVLVGCTTPQDETPIQINNNAPAQSPENEDILPPSDGAEITDLTPEDTEKYEAAIAETNEEKCESISNKLLKTQCKNGVKENKINNEEQEDKRNQQEEERKSNDDLLEELILSEDFARCSQLTLANYIVDCEVNILSDQATKAKDRKICDQASPEAKEGCYVLYDNSQLQPATQS